MQGCPLSKLVPGELLQHTIEKSASVFWEFVFTYFLYDVW